MDRAEQLRKMIEQVTPPGATEESGLESFAAESAPSEFAAANAAIARESLDLIRRGESLDTQHQFALEAIVMPYYRPVIDALDDRIQTQQLTNQWKHLGEGDLRRRIEECLLSIGRINVPQLPSLPYAGTGFIVGDGVLMTNRHVAAIFSRGVGTRSVDFQPGQTAQIDFYHELGGTKSESLVVEKVLMIHPYWDMALLKVSGLPANRKPLKLTTADPANLQDREVVTIGYPGYDPFSDQEFQNVQNRIFRGAFYVKRLQPGLLRIRRALTSYQRQVDAITHDCSTLGGNSGSAVILVPRDSNEPAEVVALHFAGQYLVANFAVPTIDLAQDSRVVDAGVHFTGRTDPRGDFYGPYWDAAESAQPTETAPPTTPGTTIQAPKTTTSSPVVHADGATWTIPIHVSVSLGTPQPAGSTAASPGPVAKISTPQAPVEGLFTREPPTVAYSVATPFFNTALASSAFDWKAALCTSLASRLAYDSAAAVRNVALNAWSFELCEFVEAEETQCFVAIRSNVVLISFRGTESVGDWIGNLNAYSIPRTYGAVHRGFYYAFSAVDERLRSLVARASGRPIVLTGHSLGGALATIAAAEWRGMFPILSIYTFGQPAVGKGGFPGLFQQNFGEKCFRFVNDDDIVPQVPPTYDHVGRLLHFTASGALKTRIESFGADAGPPTMSQAEFDHLRAVLLEQRARSRGMEPESLPGPVVEGLLPSFSDHRLDRYIANIARNAGV